MINKQQTSLLIDDNDKRCIMCSTYLPNNEIFFNLVFPNWCHYLIYQNEQIITYIEVHLKIFRYVITLLYMINKTTRRL